MSIIDTLKQRVRDARDRSPLLDHFVRTVEHYGSVNGSALAAAVTYFAFLSFFPIIALAFAVIGFVSRAYPNADEDLITAIGDVLPGIVGRRGRSAAARPSRTTRPASSASVSCWRSTPAWAGSRACASALIAVFEEPEKEKPNFILGKVRDILALLTLGLGADRQRGGLRCGDQARRRRSSTSSASAPGATPAGLGAGPRPGAPRQHGALLRVLPGARRPQRADAGRCGPGRCSARSASSCSSSSRPSCSPAPRTSRPPRRSGSR